MKNYREDAGRGDERVQKYQVMPDLSPEKYQELKASIIKNGILVPIEVDEEGNIIDGYHRAQIAQELGIECPSNTKHYPDENAKFEAAITLNADRRGGLNREEKQELIKRYIKAAPDKSSRQIADMLSVDHKTVEAQKKKLESVGEIPQQETVLTKDGKTRTRKEPSFMNKPTTGKSVNSAPYEIMRLDIHPKDDAAETIKGACETVFDGLHDSIIYNVINENQKKEYAELPIEKDIVKALNASSLYTDVIIGHYMDISILQTIGFLYCKVKGISNKKVLDLTGTALKERAIASFVDAFGMEIRHKKIMNSSRKQSDIYEKEKVEMKRYNCYAGLIASYFKEIFNENIVDHVKKGAV